MNNKRPFGLLLLGTPVLSHNNEFFFHDRCYKETLNITQRYVSNSLIVARTRECNEIKRNYANLKNSSAEIVLPLPDYGSGGLRGIIYVLKILTSSKIRNSLLKLIEEAAFVYVEGGTGPESWLFSRLARKKNRYLILEMRGSTVLNVSYMYDRFGLAGVAYCLLHHIISWHVRQRCIAGLYINQSLMNRFPVAGKLHRAASDAYLPDNFGSLPRVFKTPASSYLYVGHLEKVKRVDLILKALRIAGVELPEGWRLNIVGSGPEEERLRSLANSLDLNSHVAFHGVVEWGEPLAEFYHKADVFMMASTTEGASRSLVEAMAFGLPVITTCVGNAPELIDEGFLVPVGNAESYADSLLSLIHDTANLSESSKHNWKLAQNFRQSNLQDQRLDFWVQAIEASKSDYKDCGNF